MDVRIQHAHAQLHTYIQRSPLAIQIPNTSETDQLQHNRPATCVIAYSYSSTTFITLCFLSCKAKILCVLQKCYFQFFIFFGVLNAYV